MDNNNEHVGPIEARGPIRWLRTAVGASVLLHLLIVALVLQARLGGEPAAPTLEQALPAISVVLRRPALPPQAQAQAPASESASPAENQVTSATDDALPERSAPADTATSAPQTEAAPSQPEASGAEAVIMGSRGAAESMDAERLSASITRYMQRYEAETRENWLEQCQRFRNRYFTQDCTADPIVRGGGPGIPDADLLPLLDDDSVAGELARERYALTAPQRNFDLIPTREQAILGPTFTLIDLDGGGFIPALIAAMGLFPTRLAAPVFDESEPEQQVDEEDDAIIVEFERVPAVFGTTQ